MRPTRVELRGFTAFREPTVVDFADADLFALSGPTGAGKSTVIDAMCFALYGTVPRLDRRTVAPVISIDRNEARVRFSFTVGEDAFTAVRVVRRTPQGATTKEARLEDADGEALAGDAEAVSRVVERLLGLGFEQFTTCVVLPQGDFARFLHDTPRGRQDLLVRLLDLGVYDRARGVARDRAARAEVRAESADQQLASIGDISDEALAAADARVSELTDLEALEQRATPRIEELTAEQARARALHEETRGLLDTAAAVATPPDAAATDADVADADAAVGRAAAAVAAATAAREEAEQARSAAGDRAALAWMAAVHEQRDELLVRLERGRTVIADRTSAVRAADGAVADARQALAAAVARRDGLRTAHAAHAVRVGLSVNDPCPVCGQRVTALPEEDAPAALDEAERAHDAAAAALDAVADRAASARAGLHSAEERRGELQAQVAQLEARIGAQRDREALARELAALDRLDEALQRAADSERAAVDAERAALAAREAARQRRDDAWMSFDRVRDALAALQPPPVERTSVAAAWRRLTQWRDDAVAGLDVRLHQLEQRQAETAAAADRVVGELTAAAARAGLTLGGADDGSPGRSAAATIAEALAVARAERARIGERRQRAVELRAAVERNRAQQAVARSLARHLAANGFERWLLDEALQRLAGDASVRLRALSGEQYSLDVDAQRNFAVVDHRAADERRSARTLSGGETFLASLALALALADQVAEVAVAGAPRLESIFLDEGFGTLDPATLDTVACAIEELGAGGRTVGVVTHVRELAERLPVCFEVARTPGGARVQRVDR